MKILVAIDIFMVVIEMSLSKLYIIELAMQLLSCLFCTYIGPKLRTLFYIYSLARNFFDHVHVCILY